MAELGRIGGFNRLEPIKRDTPSDGLEKVHPQEDFIPGMKPAAAPPRNQKVEDVAKLYEKQFLREMTKAMRGTVDFGGDKPSQGESIYREQLDQQYVENWGDNGGIGLSNMIYEQLMERFFSGPGQNLKKGGPIALSDRDISKVNRLPTSMETANQVPMKVETKPSTDGSPAKIQAPWNSTVLASSQIEGKTHLTLGHPGGLKSTFIFQGVLGAEVEPGKQIEKGKTVGILSPDQNSFFWNLNRPQPQKGEI